jgi:hypothetical protein
MAQTWDPNKKSANISLSSGNLVATTTANGTSASVLGTTGIQGDRVYWEITVNGTTAAASGAGIGNASTTLTNFMGATANSLGWFNDGSVWTNNASSGTWASWTYNTRLCFAFDRTKGLLWGRVTSGNWNNSGSADPYQAVGGFSVSATLDTGFVFPGANLFNNTIPDTATAFFEPSSWQFTPPTGYVGWSYLPGSLSKSLKRNKLGKGPTPLIATLWRGDFSSASSSSNAVIAATQADQTIVAAATVGSEPIARRSPFKLLPGKGPHPLVPQPWRYYVPLANAKITATQADQTATSITATNTDHASIVVTQANQTSSITATIGSEPIRTNPPFRQLPGKGPRPLVPRPWRYYVPLANAKITATQADQTATSITATNADHASIVVTQANQAATSITATNLDHAAIVVTQANQTSVITATIGSEPIRTNPPFRQLPGKGPRPLVPRPWRNIVTPVSNAVVSATQADQAATSITATNLDHAAIVVTQANQAATSITATNLDHASIVRTQADQTLSITASVGSEPIARRSPFRLLPGRGPRPLVPQPWSRFPPPPLNDAHATIALAQADQVPTLITATSAHVASIIVSQADQVATSIVVTNKARAAIAATQANQTIAATATNLTHAHIVKAQANQTIVMTAHVPAGSRSVVAQPQFLW